MRGTANSTADFACTWPARILRVAMALSLVLALLPAPLALASTPDSGAASSSSSDTAAASVTPAAVASDAGSGGAGGSDDSSTGNNTGSNTGETATAPAITNTEDTFPKAEVGVYYWNSPVDEPYATITATGTPAPVFQLKSTDDAPAERHETTGGIPYWTGGGLPEGLHLWEQTGEIEGTPADDAVPPATTTDCTFTVIATNGTAPDAQRTFTIPVVNNNQPVLPDLYTVPDLVGVSQPTAVRRLNNLGLTVSIAEETSDQPAGTVIAQDPAAGTQVEAATTVHLTVSSGPAEPDPVEVLSLDLYAYTTDANGSFVSRLGDNGRDWADGSWWVPGGLTEKGQRVRLAASVQCSDGRAYYQNEGEWPDDVGLTWTTSDANVAVVTSQGVVVATGDGTATITATTYDGLAASMNVSVVGQSGAYPVDVAICDNAGSEYGDSRITYSDVNGPSISLYARVVFSDGTTASNAPDASDYAPENDVVSSLAWSTSNTEKGYVNPQSGVFVPRGYASLKVYATVSGGNPQENAGMVTGYVWVVIDSGNYSDDSLPADTLNVRVVYEADESHVAKEASYTVDELRDVQCAYSTYTLTSDTGYVTASACGIYLTTLFDLVGVDTNDVYGIRLAANDGVNPGLISSSFLFQPRYYLPNYEFGGNTVGAQLVFPMLAFESNWKDSARGSIDSGEDYSTIDEGTRFRLLFGSITTHDNTMSKSLKYVNTITVILNGAPPAQPDTGGDGTGGNTGGSTKGDGTAPGDGNNPNGNTPGNGGTGEGQGSSSSTKGNSTTTTSDAVQGPGSAQAANAAQTSAASYTQNASEQENLTDVQDDAESGEGTPANDSVGNGGTANDGALGSSAYRVYQMMSNANTNLQYDDWSNPWVAWAAVFLVLAAVLGAAYKALWYRSQRQGAPRMRPGGSAPFAES